ncbi:MAG: hypothetical protein AAGD25_23050 [Cyanobacteria bacterium P01_F01_bin.150]
MHQAIARDVRKEYGDRDRIIHSDSRQTDPVKLGCDRKILEPVLNSLKNAVHQTGQQNR